jgi:ABC-type multidrug transport system ATPase subunit
MKPRITLEHIGYAFDGHPAVEDVSVSFGAGRVYGISGPNGGGKTTLLDLVIGHKPPLTGSVTVDDKPLHDYSK